MVANLLCWFGDYTLISTKALITASFFPVHCSSIVTLWRCFEGMALIRRSFLLSRIWNPCCVPCCRSNPCHSASIWNLFCSFFFTNNNSSKDFVWEMIFFLVLFPPHKFLSYTQLFLGSQALRHHLSSTFRVFVEFCRTDPSFETCRPDLSVQDAEQRLAMNSYARTKTYGYGSPPSPSPIRRRMGS